MYYVDYVHITNIFILSGYTWCYSNDKAFVPDPDTHISFQSWKLREKIDLLAPPFALTSVWRSSLKWNEDHNECCQFIKKTGCYHNWPVQPTQSPDISETNSVLPRLLFSLVFLWPLATAKFHTLDISPQNIPHFITGISAYLSSLEIIEEAKYIKL